MRLLSGMLGLCLFPALLVAADWPEWGGPRCNGVSPETGLLAQWPSGAPVLRWRRVLGQGYSSFAIVQGRAYTQFQDLWGQYVACLDLDTGDTLWSHRYEIPYETAGIYPGPRSTPAVAGERVFFGFIRAVRT